MVEVDGLKRSYGSFVAVSGVDFSIGQGEIVGLLGHNGAGKTTIMKMLSGYLEPSAGSIRIDGIDLQQQTLKVQQLLGYLPENLPLYPEMSVADYLDYAATLKGVCGADRGEEMRRVIQATDLQAKILAPIATLSRGYKQRLGVAQAILGHPRLLILDEPTNGLDPTQTQQMRELIRSLSQYATVILSTHIMQEVEALCDRVLILHGGALAVDARLNELARSDRLSLLTDMGMADALRHLGTIAGVNEVLPQAGGDHPQHYQITICDSADPYQLCAAVAQRLGEQGASLYALAPERRDLETLFREVNEQQFKGVKHAA